MQNQLWDNCLRHVQLLYTCLKAQCHCSLAVITTLATYYHVLQYRTYQLQIQTKKQQWWKWKQACGNWLKPLTSGSFRGGVIGPCPWNRRATDFPNYTTINFSNEVNTISSVIAALTSMASLFGDISIGVPVLTLMSTRLTLIFL